MRKPVRPLANAPGPVAHRRVRRPSPSDEFDAPDPMSGSHDEAPISDEATNDGLPELSELQAVVARLADELSRVQAGLDVLAARADAQAERADERLTVDEAASIAHVHPLTIRNWVRSGKLAREDASRPLRIMRSALDAFLSDPAARARRPRKLAAAKRVDPRQLALLE